MQTIRAYLFSHLMTHRFHASLVLTLPKRPKQPLVNRPVQLSPILSSRYVNITCGARELDINNVFQAPDDPMPIVDFRYVPESSCFPAIKRALRTPRTEASPKRTDGGKDIETLEKPTVITKILRQNVGEDTKGASSGPSREKPALKASQVTVYVYPHF